MRTEQSARPGPVTLECETFRDHNGFESTGVTRKYTNSPQSEPAPFILQVYVQGDVTVNTDGIPNLVQHLGFDDDTQDLSWNVYRGFPDAFACIDHQREEIALRKTPVVSEKPEHQRSVHQQPIPKVAFSAHDTRLYGFLIYIDSDNLLKQPPPSSRHIDADGVYFVHFDRSFPRKSKVDRLYRLEDDPELAKSVGMPEEEILVLPEKVAVQIQRVQDTYAMRRTISSLIRKSMLDTGKYDFAMDEDEGSPRELLETTPQAFDQLVEKAKGLSLQGFNLEIRPDASVAVSSAPEEPQAVPQPPDLHYLIYPSCLNPVPYRHRDPSKDAAGLEAVAKLFTDAFAPHISPAKTVLFEFFMPPDSRMNFIIPFHKELLQSRSEEDATIGAMQTDKKDGERRRFHPISRYDEDPARARIEPYETFVVVIDKMNFVYEEGVLFVMTDGGKIKPLKDEHGNELPDTFIGPESDFVETLVLRSAGMYEVAGRLAMHVMEK